MAIHDLVKIFDASKIRVVWDDEKEKWFFSIMDVVQVLTESSDVKQYIKRLRSRDPELNLNWGTICTPLEMIARDGKRRKVQTADLEVTP